MQFRLKLLFAFICLSVCGGSVWGQDLSIVLKAGETTELQTVYWVSSCRSILTGPISVDVLEGPAGVNVSVKEGLVIPRKYNCPNEVKGGKLYVIAPQQITEQSTGTLVFRVKYPTKEGERQLSHTIKVTLYP